MNEFNYRNQLLVKISVKQLIRNKVEEAIQTFEKIVINKANFVYHEFSNSDDPKYIVMRYLFNICSHFSEITLFVCSLVCILYQKRMNEIRDLIINYLNYTKLEP